jgi:hypothetical protein
MVRLPITNYILISEVLNSVLEDIERALRSAGSGGSADEAFEKATESLMEFFEKNEIIPSV